MTPTYSRILENVHSLNDGRITQFEASRYVLNFLRKGDLSKDGIDPVEGMADLVQTLVFVKLKFSGFVERIHFKEESDFISRIEKIFV